MNMSWLWNSMQPEISGAYMFLTIERNLGAIHQTYSKEQDAANL